MNCLGTVSSCQIGLADYLFYFSFTQHQDLCVSLLLLLSCRSEVAVFFSIYKGERRNVLERKISVETQLDVHSLFIYDRKCCSLYTAR